MTGAHAAAEALTAEHAAVLRRVAGALGAGIAAFLALDVVLYVRSAGRVPDAAAVKLISLLTTMAMGWTLASILLGEFLWRRVVRSIGEPARAGERVTTGFIARSACREAGALLGAAVLLLGALNGVLRAYPAYWVNAVPALLFLAFLYARWPTLDNLRAQVRDVLPFV